MLFSHSPPSTRVFQCTRGNFTHNDAFSNDGNMTRTETDADTSRQDSLANLGQGATRLTFHGLCKYPKHIENI